MLSFLLSGASWKYVVVVTVMEHTTWVRIGGSGQDAVLPSDARSGNMSVAEHSKSTLLLIQPAYCF